ncbi:Uncharacterized protein SCF082_LOCUS53068 [Durusdinium trenchii]|uniref:SAP domain-containing protein n=1 Tax=Durusdinium trenchii TaxID=1381693 RepID=A0ABP0SQL9_9DINO
MLEASADSARNLYGLLKVPELKAELQKRGLNTVGTRKELAARLVEHETRPPEPVVESNGKERKSDEANEVSKAVQQVDSDDECGVAVDLYGGVKAEPGAAEAAAAAAEPDDLDAAIRASLQRSLGSASPEPVPQEPVRSEAPAKPQAAEPVPKVAEPKVAKPKAAEPKKAKVLPKKKAVSAEADEKSAPKKVLPRKRTQAETEAQEAPREGGTLSTLSCSSASQSQPAQPQPSSDPPHAPKEPQKTTEHPKDLNEAKDPKEPKDTKQARQLPKRPKVLPRKKPVEAEDPPSTVKARAEGSEKGGREGMLGVDPVSSSHLLKELLHQIAPEMSLDHKTLTQKLHQKLKAPAAPAAVAASVASEAPPSTFSCASNPNVTPADALEAAWGSVEDSSRRPDPGPDPPAPPDQVAALGADHPAILKVQDAMRCTARAQVLLRRKKAEEMMLQSLLQHCKAACRVYQEPEPAEDKGCGKCGCFAG